MTESLNDRANAAAGRAAATKGSQRAWKELADRQYWRDYGNTLNDRATRASWRMYGSNGAGGMNTHIADPTPSASKSSAAVSPVSSTSSSAQWDTSGRRAAYGQYAELLTKYGFNRSDVLSWLKGLDYSTLQSPALVTQAFRETSMWSDRFGGVTKAREKNGMSYINEGQIIQLEDTYRQIFTAAGIPQQYWEMGDLHNLIANDVSPQEVQDRVKLAEDAINNADPQYVRSFRDFYGIKKKDLIGYMLNREKGVQLLQEQVAAAEIGAEARGSGMDHVGRKFAENLVDKGVSRQEARQAFGSVADTEKDWRKLAKLSGEKISEKSLVKDELGLDKKGRITRKKKRLASEERARFGSSGGGTGAMGSSTSGAY